MNAKFKQFDIKGAILAGGRASRMGGVNKGMLSNQNGQSIIGYLINQMNLAGIKDVVISANDPSPYSDMRVQIVLDQQQDTGPIAGIAAVMKHYKDQCDGVMFVPCDVPNITANELISLKEAFASSKAKIVFAETDDFFWHPLCSVVHNDLADQILLAQNSDQRKVSRLWKQLGAETVKFSDASVFLNVNTLSDVNHWRGNENEKSLC